MKLQKYIAHAWICSRRKAEEYISKGLVMVNGESAHIWQVVDPDHDIIKVDSIIIKEQEKLVYYILNKPRDIITTCASSRHDHSTILDIVDIPERVFPIGRLDKETTWLIILTNDGRLSNFLIHPRYQHEKEYMVEVYGKIEDDALEKMRRGVWIDLKENWSRSWKIEKSATKKHKTKPCKIMRFSSSKFSIILEEGKNRQIRRMVSSVNYDIKRLKRIRIENIILWSLQEGEWRALTDTEKSELFERIGIQ